MSARNTRCTEFVQRRLSSIYCKLKTPSSWRHLRFRSLILQEEHEHLLIRYSTVSLWRRSVVILHTEELRLMRSDRRESQKADAYSRMDTTSHSNEWGYMPIVALHSLSTVQVRRWTLKFQDDVSWREMMCTMTIRSFFFYPEGSWKHACKSHRDMSYKELRITTLWSAFQTTTWKIDVSDTSLTL